MKSITSISTLIILCCSIILCSAITQNHFNMFKAVESGDIIALKRALVNGADVHIDGDYILKYAAYLGHSAEIQYQLEEAFGLERGEMLTIPVSGRGDRQDVVACLLQYGADRTKLTTAQMERMRKSLQAQQYVASEIHNALALSNLPELTKLLDILPLNYFSGNIRKQIQQYFASEISTMLQKRNLSGLHQLLDIIPFDYLPEQTQIQIREFTQQRALKGDTRVRKTKYS